MHEQRTLWLGRQTLSLGLPAASLSAMSTVLLIATALLVTFGSYARRETLHGVMLPSAGLVQVMAPATGWVETLHVKDAARDSLGRSIRRPKPSSPYAN